MTNLLSYPIPYVSFASYKYFPGKTVRFLGVLVSLGSNGPGSAKFHVGDGEIVVNLTSGTQLNLDSPAFVTGTVMPDGTVQEIMIDLMPRSKVFNQKHYLSMVQFSAQAPSLFRSIN